MPNYFLWPEDSTSGLEFWKLIAKYRYNEKLHVREDLCSNSSVVEAVIDLDPGDDIYFIAVDHVSDNAYIRELYDLLEPKVQASCGHIRLIPILCFEETMLRFPLISQWAHISGTKREIILNDVLQAISHDRIKFSRLQTKEGRDFVSSFKNDHSISSEVKLKSLANLALQANDWTLNGHLGKCWYADCCTPGQEGIYVHRKWCQGIPESGDDRLQMLIDSPAVQKLLQPIDKVLLGTEDTYTTEMSYF